MKTTKFLLMAFLAFVVFSCSKDDNKSDGNGGKTIKVTIKTGSVQHSRGDYSTAPTDYVTTVTAFDLYFFTGGSTTSTFVEKGQITISGTNTTDGVTTEILEGIDGNANYVCIVANGAGLTTTPGMTLAAFNALTLDIATQNPDVTSLTDKTGLASIMLSSAGGLTAVTDEDDYDKTVTLEIAPLVARVEIDKLGLKSGHKIVSFAVNNVYTTNVFPSFTVVGGASGTKLESASEAPFFPSWPTCFVNAVTGVAANGSGSIVSFTDVSLNGGGNGVFAYQVAAGTTLPYIVIELADDFSFMADMDENSGTPDELLHHGAGFVTVVGYTSDEGGTTPITEFKPGYIYKVETLKFAEGDVTKIPTKSPSKGIQVVVSVKKWVIEAVYPVI